MTTLPPEYVGQYADDPPGIEPKAAPASILKAERAPVTRYRRAALIGGITAVALVLGYGVVVTLQPPPKSKTSDAPTSSKDAGPQGPNDVTNRYPDGYADPAAQNVLRAAGEGGEPCPRDAAAPASAGRYSGYADPGAGAPVAPGTISLACQPAAVTAAAGQVQPAQLTPEQQAVVQRQQVSQQQFQAATASGPFFVDGGGARPQGATSSSEGHGPAESGFQPLPAALQSPGAPLAPPIGDVGVQNGQGEKRQFADRARAQDYLASPYLPPLSPYEVKAGAVIPAALVTAINSDLPGEVIAQVTENVYDHISGRYVLIPQGSRLIGQYDSEVAYGQDRALVAWNRIIMPNGYSINIGSMTGADLSGASGLHDQVDAHFWQLVRGIALSTVVTIGAASAQDTQARASGGLVLNDTISGISNSANQATQQFVTRDLNRQPTIKIRPGWPVRVLVNKDMVLQPYRP